ncbi:ParB N-terminal domain-containing protein [Frankia nepalensis]|uniref:hypothetical protein n=1 Tax=Frankia nepalensis TaxID=1836974 RepID=UPI001EE41B03|nr:hypothetical protein [Frankia nepalensis]
MRLELRSLRPGPRVRLGRINRSYVEELTQCGGGWPPILVRRADNTIVDGVYRYLAARELGHADIECLYYDGESGPAFLEALRLNLRHGLPLSLREREAAARRVLRFYPDWSDRRLGEVCGLAPGTIGRLRGSDERAPGENEQVNARVGRDGKRYPTDPGASRERIIRLLREEPDRSLRSVAQATGTSPATVRAVKAGLARPAQALPSPAIPPVARAAVAQPSVTLVKDPSDAAASRTDAPAASTAADDAAFARWFARTDITDDWRDLVPNVPATAAFQVLDEARRRARLWLEFASALESRARPAQVRLGA